MKKKVLSFALAAVLSAGLLTACGSDASTTAAQTDAAAPESTAAAVTEEAGSESTAARKLKAQQKLLWNPKERLPLRQPAFPTRKSWKQQNP